MELLRNSRAIARNIEGTDEIRTIMRHDTHGYRIRYGLPLFVTISPDEKHNLIMLRMVRVRASDPAAAQDEFERKLGQLRESVLLEENDISATSVHLEELT